MLRILGQLCSVCRQMGPYTPVCPRSPRPSARDLVVWTVARTTCRDPSDAMSHLPNLLRCECRPPPGESCVRAARVQVPWFRPWVLGTWMTSCGELQPRTCCPDRAWRCGRAVQHMWTLLSVIKSTQSKTVMHAAEGEDREQSPVWNKRQFWQIWDPGALELAEATYHLHLQSWNDTIQTPQDGPNTGRRPWRRCKFCKY